MQSALTANYLAAIICPIVVLGPWYIGTLAETGTVARTSKLALLWSSAKARASSDLLMPGQIRSKGLRLPTRLIRRIRYRFNNRMIIKCVAFWFKRQKCKIMLLFHLCQCQSSILVHCINILKFIFVQSLCKNLCEQVLVQKTIFCTLETCLRSQGECHRTVKWEVIRYIILILLQ